MKKIFLFLVLTGLGCTQNPQSSSQSVASATGIQTNNKITVSCINNITADSQSEFELIESAAGWEVITRYKRSQRKGGPVTVTTSVLSEMLDCDKLGSSGIFCRGQHGYFNAQDRLTVIPVFGDSMEVIFNGNWSDGQALRFLFEKNDCPIFNR